VVKTCIDFCTVRQVHYSNMRPPHINLDQLVTFFFVARERSLSRASEQLCVSVPAVAKQMKCLEAAFRVKLISVRKKKIYLTNMGTMLFPYAEAVYHSSLKAESLLFSSKNDLRVGVSFALTRRFLPVLDRFKEAHPSVAVTLRESSSLRLLAELLEFQHDLCIVATPSVISGELLALRIPQPERVFLVAAPGTPLAKKKRATWEDLNDYPLVLHGEGSLSRKLILDEFQRRGVRPFIAASVDGVEATKELVEQGIGAGFMTPCNIEEDVAIERLKIVPLKGGEVKLSMDIVLHRGVIQTVASRAFLSLIGEHFNCNFPVA
jgi:LysR family transcriptional regulator, low CO2-responsive transcriptional regulator